MKCPVCNKDIKPDEPAVQVRDGHLNEDEEFLPEQDDAYYHSNCYGVMLRRTEGYTHPELLEKAKSRCTDCHAETTKGDLYWCDEGDCDITAVVNCKEWEDEEARRID